jgi:hypothetical protein
MTFTLLSTLSPLSFPIRPPSSLRLLDAPFGFPSRGAVTGVESASLILEVKQLWPADGAYHCPHAGLLRRLSRGQVSCISPPTAVLFLKSSVEAHLSGAPLMPRAL